MKPVAARGAVVYASCCVAISFLATACGIPPSPRPAAQNPSPMVEHARAHERLSDVDSARGQRFRIEGLLPATVHVFVPDRKTAVANRLLVHFHGAPFIGEHAVAGVAAAAPGVAAAVPGVAAEAPGYILASVSLGAGSGVYERPFNDPTMFTRLVAEVSQVTGLDIDAVMLSGFSAGYGAIRSILRHHAGTDRIEGVMLLDGLHTSYVPERVVIHEGGTLDTTLLEPFIEFARRAVAGEVRFLITHSEIFPGTFASTTETTDHIIEALGLERTPVLEWGPVGMQQVSAVAAGGLAILGFAGNTAPDHVDHLHAMPQLLRLYDRLPVPGASR